MLDNSFFLSNATFIVALVKLISGHCHTIFVKADFGIINIYTDFCIKHTFQTNAIPVVT